MSRREPEFTPPEHDGGVALAERPAAPTGPQRDLPADLPTLDDAPMAAAPAPLPFGRPARSQADHDALPPHAPPFEGELELDPAPAPRRPRRTWIAAAAALAVAAAGWAVMHKPGGGLADAQPRPTAPLPTQVAPVAPKPVAVPAHAAASRLPTSALPPIAPVASEAGGGLDCMILPHQIVALGTATAGIVQSIHVDRGDVVRRGQTLVMLNAGVERAAVAVAREKALQSGEVEAARGAEDLARREAERASRLVEENFVSRTYFDKQAAEERVARGRGAQAAERQRLAARELELANEQLALRTVVAPIDGVVVERLATPGEFVEQKPVLRLAAMDPLRVDVLVPASAYGQVKVGAQARVVPDLLDRTPRTATVTSVDRLIDAASSTFRVRLALPNPGHQLPAGLRCQVRLDGVEAAAPASPPSARPAG